MTKKKVFVVIIILILSMTIDIPKGYAADSSVKDWLEEKEVNDSKPSKKKDSSDTITTEMEKDSLAISIVKTIVLLGLILFLIYFLLKLLNKKNRLFQQSKTLENLGGISLGQNKSIQVIRVGEKMYLIGVGDNVELLQEVSDEVTKKALLDNDNQQQKISQTNLFSLFMMKRNKRAHTKDQDKGDFSRLFQKELNQMKENRKTIRNQYERRKDINE
ncbi:flagellar biosynthetic protein FliO [Cerasibacillus terrae]|uniref:Flagellar protein n=1 Tax=Cerasibacillus terrae TaxID=2498845 RepID=A0A5C8P2V2_9BACI|nr:flagellar biosynthetic protein FliO [Cerasibacillus terrae]TXL67692.1 flagellar biosynthetic protein FliO [Cerasibacillus terrae]